MPKFVLHVPMKNIIVLIAITGISVGLTAQITITSAHMPAANDSFTYMNVQAVGGGVNVNTTGPNTTWNYSSLVKTDSTVVRYERSSQTPYAFYFINTFGQKIADNIGFGQFSMSDVYSFYKNTNTSFTAEGTGFKFNSIPLAGTYTDKDDIYLFPLKYNDRDSSNFRVSIQIPALGSYKQSGRRVNHVDGWGTITLPGGGSPQQCLRVKSTITQVDSFSVTQPLPISFGFPSTRVEYKWLTTTDKVPVLEVSGTELLGTFTPTSIRYRTQSKTNTGPGIFVNEVNNARVAIYPNPATEKIVVSIPNLGETFIKVVTMEGKEIPVTFARTGNTIEIDTRSLSQGYYMLLAKSGNEVIWEKFQIVAK